MENEKDKKFLAVSQAVLNVLFEDGLNKLNITKVANRSKVSRAWIYQYMGKNRNGLIEIAAESCSAFFARAHLTSKPEDLVELMHQLSEGAEFSMRTSIKYPIFLNLYFKYKGSENAIGVAISKYEKLWIKNFTLCFKRILQLADKKAETLAQTILLMRMGFSHRLISEPNQEKNIIDSINQLKSVQLILIEAASGKAIL